MTETIFLYGKGTQNNVVSISLISSIHLSTLSFFKLPNYLQDLTTLIVPFFQDLLILDSKILEFCIKKKQKKILNELICTLHINQNE